MLIVHAVSLAAHVDDLPLADVTGRHADNAGNTVRLAEVAQRERFEPF